MRTYTGKRDYNEKVIVEELRAKGFRVILMREGVGCDLLVISPGQIRLAEVKNGKIKFTPAEEALRLLCEEMGVGYYVLTDVGQLT